MRVTIDLPIHVLREAKAQAAVNGLNLSELIALYVAAGLRRTGAGSRRSQPPVISKATTGRPIPALTRKAIRQIEKADDEARAG